MLQQTIVIIHVRVHRRSSSVENLQHKIKLIKLSSKGRKIIKFYNPH